MRTLVESTAFRKDREARAQARLRRCEARCGYLQIATWGALPASNRPHRLKGEWKGYSECHVGPDWLLIYKVTDDEVRLARTGTHADLFEE
jgi:mRNA interferase YafQ